MRKLYPYSTKWEKKIVEILHIYVTRAIYLLFRTNTIVLRRRLAGSGTEPTEGAEKVGTTGEDFGEGGRG